LPPASPAPTPTRAIALLALAGFSGQAMVRAADSLLPQIAADIGVTVGAASIIVTAYAITHGSVQLVIGPIGDYFGKFRMVAVACALSARHGAGVRTGAIADHAHACAHRDRDDGSLDHPARHGLRRRRGAV